MVNKTNKLKKTKATERPSSGNKVRQITEEKLIDAAEQVFAEHGFKGATTRLISQQANVNIALINRYFEGKYGLFMSVIQKRSQHSSLAKLNYPAQATFSKECYQFMKMKIALYKAESNFFKIVLTTLLTDEEFQDKFHKAFIKFEDNLEIVERFEKLKKEKKLSPKLHSAEYAEMLCVHTFGTFVGGKLSMNLSDEELDTRIKYFSKLICIPYELN